MTDERRPPLVEGVHYYRQGRFLVFTDLFLRERGYCCESGCRHCPYGFRPDRRTDVPEVQSDAPAGDQEE